MPHALCVIRGFHLVYVVDASPDAHDLVVLFGFEGVGQLLLHGSARVRLGSVRQPWIPVPKANATDTDVPDIIMLTSDVALLFVRSCVILYLYLACADDVYDAEPTPDNPATERLCEKCRPGRPHPPIWLMYRNTAQRGVENWRGRPDAHPCLTEVSQRSWYGCHMCNLLNEQDTEYLAIVEEFAADQAALDVAFSNAW